MKALEPSHNVRGECCTWNRVRGYPVTLRFTMEARAKNERCVSRPPYTCYNTLQYVIDR